MLEVLMRLAGNEAVEIAQALGMSVNRVRKSSVCNILPEGVWVRIRPA